MRLHLLPLLLVLAACGKPSGEAPGSARAAATVVVSAKASAPTSTAPVLASAAVAKMVDGARFVPVFAPAEVFGATERQDRPTKQGFAEAAYKKGKDDLATVTITDTTGVPGVRDDYKDPRETVAGFPLKTSGYTKSAILVADRFQIQIQSQRIKAPERKALFEKMDLEALQALE